MNYILTVGIKDFLLTEEQKDLYLTAVERGAKQVQLSDSLFVSTNFQSLVAEDELNINPIISNPNYQELLTLKGKTDDASVRRKMYLERAINIQFPYEKFADEWGETYRGSTQIIKKK